MRQAHVEVDKFAETMALPAVNEDGTIPELPLFNAAATEVASAPDFDLSASAARVAASASAEQVSTGFNVMDTALHEPVSLPQAPLSTGLARKGPARKAARVKPLWLGAGAMAVAGAVVAAMLIGPSSGAGTATKASAGEVARRDAVPGAVERVALAAGAGKTSREAGGANGAEGQPVEPFPSEARFGDVAQHRVTLESAPKASVWIADKQVGETPMVITWPSDGEPPAIVLKANGRADTPVALADDAVGTTVTVALPAL